MPKAQGSQTSLAFMLETVWGTTPAGQFKGVSFSAEDFNFVSESKASNNVRPDRQTADIKRTGGGAEGGFESDLQITNLDYIFPGLLWSDTDWLNAGTVSGTTSFAVETGAGVGGKITFPAATVDELEVGHFFLIENALDSANNGVFKVKDITGQVVQVFDPLVTEAATAGVTLSGETIRNGVKQYSYSVEESFLDIGKYFLGTGMVPDTFEMTIESEDIITAKCSFIGKDWEPKDVITSSPAATDLSTLPVLVAGSSVGGVYIDETLLESCEVQKFDFSFANKAEGRKSISVLGNCGVAGKSIELTGSITLYFENHIQYNRYKASEFFSLDVTLYDEFGNMYIIAFDAVFFDSLSANVTGKDDDVLLEGTWTAKMGPNGFTLQVTRVIV